MSPWVHGRCYPEIQSSRLLSYTLRILVDPTSIKRVERSLLDIDTLRQYLIELKSPCKIVLMMPAQIPGQFKDEYDFMNRLGVELLPTSTLLVPEAAAVFPDHPGIPAGVAALASTALIGNADIILSSDIAVQQEVVNRFLDLYLTVRTGEDTKRDCEVFVRGHEIPWSFNEPAWQMPWTTFYPMMEPDSKEIVKLQNLASQKSVSSEIQEEIRALGLLRWSTILYTRDKLLFYLLQRMVAKREKLDRQGFVFELTYYLTHYYLLFWGGLDQICWIANEICGLGFSPKQWREVGVAKVGFLKSLSERAPEIGAEFTAPDFLHWIDLLKLTRHYVAHHGTAWVGPVLEQPTNEPTEAEIDQEIEKWPDWIELAKIVPPEQLESYRPTLRTRWRLKNYRQLADAVFSIPHKTGRSFIFPFKNINWDFEQFRTFALGVARKCMARLEARSNREAIEK